MPVSQTAQKTVHEVATITNSSDGTPTNVNTTDLHGAGASRAVRGTPGPGAWAHTAQNPSQSRDTQPNAGGSSTSAPLLQLTRELPAELNGKMDVWL